MCQTIRPKRSPTTGASRSPSRTSTFMAPLRRTFARAQATTRGLMSVATRREAMSCRYQRDQATTATAGPDLKHGLARPQQQVPVQGLSAQRKLTRCSPRTGVW